MMIRTLIALIASIVLVACNNNEGLPQRSENDMIVDNIIAQCEGFETKDIAQCIVGEWKDDAELIYNDDWSAIERVYSISGVSYSEGGASELYTFSADGRGSLVATNSSLGPEIVTFTYQFDWQYDATNRMLVLSGELNRQFKVSGFNSEYIVLDYVNSTNQNIREILKKVK